MSDCQADFWLILTWVMFVPSNQRRIPGNLYAVKKVVRSIHIDYIKKERSVTYVYVFMCVCAPEKTVTHSKFVVRIHFSLPHRSGVLKPLNVVGFIEAKK